MQAAALGCMSCMWAVARAGACGGSNAPAGPVVVANTGLGLGLEGSNNSGVPQCEGCVWRCCARGMSNEGRVVCETCDPCVLDNTSTASPRVPGMGNCYIVHKKCVYVYEEVVIRPRTVEMGPKKRGCPCFWPGQAPPLWCHTIMTSLRRMSAKGGCPQPHKMTGADSDLVLDGWVVPVT